MAGQSYLAALDVGTSKVAVAVGEATADTQLHVIGIGLADARGIRRGRVVDAAAAVSSIADAIAQAEFVSSTRIEAVHLGLSGALISGYNARGVVSVASPDRVITPEDVARAVDAATAAALPEGRDIVHVLPQEFVIDDADGVLAPVGLTGMRLEANVHVVTANVLAAQNLIAAVENAGISILSLVLDPLAASESVLTAEEKELGVALVDIGASMTTVAIWLRGSLWHCGVIATGGDHFTSAVAVGLRTPLPDAEKIKRRHGWVVPTIVDDQETIEVPSLGSRPARRVPQRALSQTLEVQAQELFAALRDDIRYAGYEKAINAGIVLTGGGAILGGMPHRAEQILEVPVRRGTPAGVKGLTDDLNAPALATSVGLLLYAHRHPRVLPGRILPGLRGRRPTRLRAILGLAGLLRHAS